MMDIITIKTDTVAEFTEKKSQFIGHAFYVENEEEAHSRIQTVKTLHNTATHNVFAYNLRLYNTQRFNDDGEPKGTAGIPVLSVIKNNKLVDVCVVVTRYFGGILLGAGGLVRAYSKAATMSLQAAGQTPIILVNTFKLEYTYDLHNNIQRILDMWGAIIINQSFLEKVTVEATITDDKFIPMTEVIKSIYYKNIEITELKKEYSRRI